MTYEYFMSITYRPTLYFFTLIEFVENTENKTEINNYKTNNNALPGYIHKPSMGPTSVPLTVPVDGLYFVKNGMQQNISLIW